MLPNRPDRSTIFRWASKGFCGVRLRTVSVGRTRHTTERWLLSFFDEVACARASEGDTTVPRPTPGQRGDARAPVESRTARILREHGLSEAG
ncbi:MAG: DUF1580 domain-containing protein [Planctomycetota bacterium]